MNTLFRTPLLWWAAVVMAAMLAFYVHLLQVQVAQGALRRDAFTLAAQRMAGARARPPAQKLGQPLAHNTP